MASLGFCVSPPKEVVATRSKQSVMGILWVTTVERGSHAQHHEQDDSSGEQIDTGAGVRLVEVDLRRHIGGSSEVGVQVATAVAAEHGAGEAEIGEFQIEAAVEHHVFRLEVAVRHVVAMHVVESLHELPEVEPGNILGEATRLGHEVKEFSSRDELKHKVVDVLGALVRVDHLSIFLLNHVDNIRVVKICKCLNLSLDKIQEVTSALQDFNGISAASAVFGKLDFTGYSAAKSLSYLIFSKCGRHTFQLDFNYNYQNLSDLRG